MNRTQWISETCALAIVAIATAAAAWGLAVAQVVGSALVTVLIAGPSMLALALYAWHVNEKTKNAAAEQWKGAAIFTPFLGAVFFAIDVFIGSTNGHYDNLVQAGFHAGSPFGIVLTMLVCPIGTIVSLGGWVRCSMLERIEPDRLIDD